MCRRDTLPYVTAAVPPQITAAVPPRSRPQYASGHVRSTPLGPRTTPLGHVRVGTPQVRCTQTAPGAGGCGRGWSRSRRPPSGTGPPP
eukprot:2679369-Rhodomonas_salina.2